MKQIICMIKFQRLFFMLKTAFISWYSLQVLIIIPFKSSSTYGFAMANLSDGIYFSKLVLKKTLL